MKKIIKIFGVMFIAMSLVSINVSASNNPSNVILQGDASGIVFIDGDKPFLESVGMIPGDSTSRRIVIKNDSNSPFKVYMRAERVTPIEEHDLFNKLELEILYKENLIYEGSASGEDGLEKDIYLGIYKPGEEANLYAKVYLDGPSTGNEYKNKFAQVNWIFTAVSDEDIGVIKPEVKPETKPEVKPEVKPGKSPNTGDSGIGIYIILALISLFLLRGKIFKSSVKEG